MKRTWWLVAVLAVLLLIVLWVIFFFPKNNGAGGNENLAFPQSGTGATRTASDSPSAGGVFGFLSSVPKPNQNYSIPNSRSPVTQNDLSKPNIFSYPTRVTPSQASTAIIKPPTSRTPTVTVLPRPNIFYPTVAPYQPSHYTFSTSTPGPQIIGHARNGDSITFDPLSGDLHVGEYHFNFGMGPVPNGATSDVVGDPENVALGTNIGIFIGSLLGDPGLGLALGSAIGSNLVSGYRLSDLGIGLQNGLVTLGGQDAIAALTGGSGLDSLLGGSGLGSVTGSGSGGGGVFGGTLTIISVCDVGTLYTVVGRPYSGLLMWIEGVSSVPPYAYADGAPPIEGPAIGHYSGLSVCVVGDVTVGEGPVMYGYGTGAI